MFMANVTLYFGWWNLLLWCFSLMKRLKKTLFSCNAKHCSVKPHAYCLNMRKKNPQLDRPAMTMAVNWSYCGGVQQMVNPNWSHSQTHITEITLMGRYHTILASYPRRNPWGLLISRGNERFQISLLRKWQTCHFMFAHRHAFAASQHSRPGNNFQFKSSPAAVY